MISIIILLVLFLLVIFARYMSRPIRHRITNINDLRKHLNGFISQCRDGSILIITHKETGRFLQFALYLPNKNDLNLHFGFPDAPWSRDFFDNLVDNFSSASINYNIDTLPRNNKVRRFLTVDYIENVDEGVKIAKLALKSMGLPESGVYQVHIEGWLRPDLLKRLH